MEPYVRFEGEVGEQWTMFLLDPAGNALEFKAFADDSQVFATCVDAGSGAGDCGLEGALPRCASAICSNPDLSVHGPRCPVDDRRMTRVPARAAAMAGGFV